MCDDCAARSDVRSDSFVPLKTVMNLVCNDDATVPSFVQALTHMDNQHRRDFADFVDLTLAERFGEL